MSVPFPERDDVRRDLQARAESVSFSKRVRWRLGRRGAFLVMMGTMFGILGYSYGFIDLPPATMNQLAMPIRVGQILLGIEDPALILRFWGFLWILSGTVAVVTAWWPPGRDDLGFRALWIYSSVWAVLNLLGEALLDAPRAAVVGVIFGVYAASVLIVSGMADPPPISKVVIGDGSDPEHSDHDAGGDTTVW